MFSELQESIKYIILNNKLMTYLETYIFIISTGICKSEGDYIFKSIYLSHDHYQSLPSLVLIYNYLSLWGTLQSHH